ncbi:hypothetical protein CAC42_7329 [Sphaceloma murrayae]|uniref:5'-3' DNA helicase ZGRF1-like N-terminal domain-containing protein n=1 Tax=Sphaceloma murrayae TaxID=2082308 RepID=A0A2K1QWQ3_9PEZI|nr:hypothetical protein CAC42_7329 [Sphaceloma murrayae]
MTSTFIRGSLSTQIPQTQNTAPVLEFRCLYTRDLRRKAKRWQDGFLRYHTFNRRVMVYDTLRTFIGDTFNPGGAELQEGDEIDLEKHYVMVQVSEPTGTTQTDLTELMESRHKNKDATKADSPASHRISQESASVPYQKHRSLSALLGTPKGPLGKASLPTTSPFEDRQKRKAHLEHKAAKRQKQSQYHVAASVPTRRHPSPGSSPTRGSTASAPAPRKEPARPKPSKIIDLSSDTISKDDGVDVSSCNLDEGRSLKPYNLGPERHKPPMRPIEPMTTRHDREITPNEEDSLYRRRPLKVISNAPRKMLICQQPKARAEHKSQANPKAKITRDATPASLQTNAQPLITHRAEEAPLAPHQQRLKERLARLGQKKPRQIVPSSTPDEEPDTEIGRDQAGRSDALQEPTTLTAVPRSAPTLEKPHNQHAPAADHTIKPKASKQPCQPPGDPVQAGRRSSLPTLQPSQALPMARVQPSKHTLPPVLRVQPEVISMPSPVVATTANPPTVAAQSVALPVNAQAQPGQRSAPRTITRSDSDPMSKPFKPLTRSVLNSGSRGKAAEAPTIPQSADPLDFGPWSREAFDLFDWWPPDRDKQGHKISTGASTTA